MQPTEAQQKTFDAAFIGAAPIPEPEEEQASLSMEQAGLSMGQAGAGGAGINTGKPPLQGQGDQKRQPAPAAYAPGMGAPTNAALPPGTGAPTITAEQQQLLSGAGISFFNNSWSKVASLPQGGYSVTPVDVRSELMKLERSRGGNDIMAQRAVAPLSSPYRYKIVLDNNTWIGVWG
jgi:hypothetical protein